MSDIFISYSKSDHALALKLSAFLESEGWTVWWDKSLGAADLYRDEIMKQLVAARAVITIWTENSVRSDWVRAEAGRAKADGKLIPVKTPELTYADIPLPFGEMHTENVASSDLIRAAVVAQLAKPATQVSPVWQITGLFKYQVLTWIGIVGTAITLFANLNGVLDLADWAKDLVVHWHEWTQMFWGWVFGLLNVKLPREIVPIISFGVFATLLVVGVNLFSGTGTKSDESLHSIRLRRKLVIFTVGVILYVVLRIVVSIVSDTLKTADRNPLSTAFLEVMLMIGFPLGYMLWFSRERSWIVLNSLLFLFMSACLLIVPLRTLMSHEQRLSTEISLMVVLSTNVLLQICWMAVILFSPLRQLTRRLGFVVLGVLTLIALSEISKLNLHHYMQPTRVSKISSPTHNVPSHAAA